VVERVPADRSTPAAFGDQLRRAREGAGLEIEDIVAETKISSRILGALEQGDFTSLPERVFARSFVAQYARTVGVDETPLLPAFDAAWEAHTVESGRVFAIDVAPEDLGPPIKWRFWFPIAAGAVILLVAAAVILRGSTPSVEGLSPDPRRSVVSSAVEAGTNTVNRLPTRSPPPSTAVEEPPESTLVRMTVEVDAEQECWIHYRDRNGMTGERLLRGGQSVALELTGPVKLTVGNAGAVRVTVDGRTYGDLGLPGQVVHTEVTDRGFTPLDAGGFDS
jgi:cytoskeletal protein RodZ